MDDNYGGLSHSHMPASGSSYLAKRIVVGTILMCIVLFVLVVFMYGKHEGEQAPGVWVRATLIELGDAELRVLQVLGAPTCEGTVGDEKIWIHAADETERSECKPLEGDLVVYFDEEGEVAGYDPEHGVRTSVRSDVDQERFRRSVAAPPPSPARERQGP